MNLIDKIPKQVKATVAFIIASTITQGLSLLVTPLFVRIMTTEQIGIVTNFNSWNAIIGVIVNMVLYSSSYVIGMNEFPNERDEYTSCAMSVSLLISGFFLIVSLTFSDQIAKALDVDHNLLLLMCVGFSFLPATNFWLARQRYEYSYLPVLLFSVISAVLATGVSILAVYCADDIGVSAAEARLYGTYLVNIPIAIFFTVSILFKGKTIFRKKYLKFIIIVNSPMIVHSFAKNVLDVSDRVMITSLIGESAAGIYGTLYSISTLIAILWNAINIGITPYMFSQMNEIENQEGTLRRFTNTLLFVFFVLSIIIVLISPEIVGLFTTAEYVEAIGVVPPLISGCFVTAIYSVIGNVLLYNKKTNSVMLATILAGATNIILNRIFIPTMGYHAAAYTTIVGYIVLTVSLYCSTKKIKNNTPNFIDVRFMVMLSALNVMTSSILKILYPYAIARYGIIILIIVLALLNRRKIQEILKMVYGNKS